ncbi:hypothetical protein MHH60_23100 [Paenibacillus sp. FSL H7-0716]|uniref:Uncharacterized protein n=1 Tax=Paenibacillus odorifer TaxID=189426 RepID=A0AB36J4M6_9BACL|nr:hypothetical protein [Paenibacillus odorifer]OME09667.1 hypothetical protein BSK47_31905 [Paenibacillus odorifer]
MKVTLNEPVLNTPAYYGLTISQWVTLGAVLVTLIIGLINLFSSLRTNKRTTFVNAVTSERVKWMGQLRELTSEYLQLTTYYERKPILEGKEHDDFFERLVYLQHRIKLHMNHTGVPDREINELIKRINEKIFEIYQANDLLKIPPEDRLQYLLSSSNEIIKKKLIQKQKEGTLTQVLNPEESKDNAIQFLNEIIEEYNKEFKQKNGYSGRNQLEKDVQDLVDKTSAYLKYEWERVKDEAKEGKLKKQKKKEWKENLQIKDDVYDFYKYLKKQRIWSNSRDRFLAVISKLKSNKNLNQEKTKEILRYCNLDIVGGNTINAVITTLVSLIMGAFVASVLKNSQKDDPVFFQALIAIVIYISIITYLSLRRDRASLVKEGLEHFIELEKDK